MAKILLIDDEEEVFLFVNGALGKEHNVTMKTSWLQASNTLFQESFDLILLDIDMPGLPGDKLAEILQKRLRDTILNIVIFSGLEEDELEKKADAIGAKGYIRKPCPPDIFALRVRRFLR
jgi:PleD family two-component response regulator